MKNLTVDILIRLIMFMYFTLLALLCVAAAGAIIYMGGALIGVIN